MFGRFAGGRDKEFLRLARKPNMSRSRMKKEGFADEWDSYIEYKDKMTKEFGKILDKYLPKFEESNSDTLLISTHGDRCDLIATEYYGDPSFWWYIASVNNLKSNNIEAGTQLRVPVSIEQAVLK